MNCRNNERERTPPCCFLLTKARHYICLKQKHYWNTVTLTHLLSALQYSAALNFFNHCLSGKPRIWQSYTISENLAWFEIQARDFRVVAKELIACLRTSSRSFVGALQNVRLWARQHRGIRKDVSVCVKFIGRPSPSLCRPSGTKPLIFL